MCDFFAVLYEGGIPRRGWRRWLWIGSLSAFVIAAGAIVYVTFT
jgi:hypothetical protein